MDTKNRESSAFAYLSVCEGMNKNEFIITERCCPMGPCYKSSLFRKEKNRLKFHKKIESLLLKQQLKFESEYFLDGFRLDLAIPEFGIAIEPAGRVFHYNANGYEKAKDIIRSKILKKLGWRVFNIDSSNWAKMNLEKQEQFIKQLSKQVRDL
ncbi:MAG TPA: RAP domain-containing protein, partial [Leptospiraceae bacterium]|nr:RAP domain-containing protein [Leptospiraceae bacterium]